MKLKKFLAQKEVNTVIYRLVQTFNTAVRIENHKGTELLAEGNSSSLDEATRHPVIVGDDTIGWVIGSPVMQPIADLLSYLAKREAERKQLGNEVLDKYREISLLYTLSERLQSSLDVETVARVTLEEAGRLINVDGGALLMYNADKNLLETICVHGTGYTRDMVFTPGVGITGGIFQMGQAEIVNNVTQDSRYSPIGRPISSLICATLKSDKGTLGAMVMSSATPVEFTASDLQLFKTVASQAAPAIERAILYETLEEKVRQRTAELRYRAVQLEASIGVGQRITSILTVDTLLTEVADLIQYGFNYTYVGIFLVSETNNQLIASTQVGESGREVVAAELETHDDYQVIIDWVAENRTVLRVDDLANDEKYAHIRLKSAEHSELALPLIMGERLLGVLDIQSTTPFRDDDIPLLQSLAAQVAIAINNAALYEAEQERRQITEALYNAGRAISSSLDLNEVLDNILESLNEIVPYDRASVMLAQDDDMLTVVAGRGFPPDMPLPRVRISEQADDVFYRIHETRQPLAVDDALSEAGWHQVQGLPQARSWLGVPLTRFENVIGMLSLTRETLQPYSSDETTLAATFAGQAAVALENARLYDEITRFSQTLEEMVKQRTEDLQIAYDRLEKLDRTKSDFISVASHELRTPITVLQGYSQMLMIDPAIQQNAFHKEQLAGIYQGATRLHEIVNSMLDVAKIDGQTFEIFTESVEIIDTIDKVTLKLEGAAEERDISLTVEDLSGLPMLNADPDALYKAFYQLVINAIKYTPDGGSVNISGRTVPADESRLAQDSVELVVRDTGIGIDPTFHDLIFTKFYQTGQLALHSTGKTKFKGAGPGLGLAIVRGTVEAHGGKVWVVSSGHNEETCPGSAFHVLLPLIAQPQPQEATNHS